MRQEQRHLKIFPLVLSKNLDFLKINYIYYKNDKI